MRKLLFLLVSILFVSIMSCTNDKAETKKEVIVVPSKQIIIEKETAPKGTSISLDKNGVKIETKNH